MIAIVADAEGVFRVPAHCRIVSIEAYWFGSVILCKPVVRVKAGRRVIVTNKRPEFGWRPFDFMEE